MWESNDVEGREEGKTKESEREETEEAGNKYGRLACNQWVVCIRNILAMLLKMAVERECGNSAEKGWAFKDDRIGKSEVGMHKI